MAVIDTRNCPLCGVYIKPANLHRHIDRVHPRYSEEVPKVSIDSSKCPICGKINSPQETHNGLSVCNSHYLKDIRPLLVGSYYRKLKEKNTEYFASKAESAFHSLRLQLNAIFQSLGWCPEEASASQFLSFAEISLLTGYQILRFTESIPDLPERLFLSAESANPPKANKKIEQEAAFIIIQLNAEFELFRAIKLGSTGLYQLAVDNEKSPKNLLIIPNLEEDAIRKLLLLLLRDANDQWRGTLRRFLVPTGVSSAQDDFGCSFWFNRSLINEHFDMFKGEWNRTFNVNTQMSSSDFENLWDWLKWVVSIDGVTENNQDKATHFSSYKDMGLTKELVFQIFSEVLPDIHDQLPLISFKNLSRPDPYGLTQQNLAALARAFKSSSAKGYAYHFSCREWFYNTVMPVFVNFARRLELAGGCFEEDMKTLSNLYSRGVKPSSKSALGYMFEPKLDDATPSGPNTSRSIPWRKLEENYKITLEEGEITKKIGNTTEVDLVIYANMNLYLIELKAINLNCNNAIKYVREKAPVQCAKYSLWAKQKNFKELLNKHKIEKGKLKAVRVLVCSSGIFEDLAVTCQETGESFAVVSEFSLFSTMAGLFHLSLKDPFPINVSGISAGLKITDDTVRQVLMIDADQKIRQQISKQLITWTKLITTDRREIFQPIRVEEKEVESATFFGRGYVAHEAYVGDTVSWILEKPYLFKEYEQYKFYLGTQLGNGGQTIICSNCKSATKYYLPDDVKEAAKVEEVIGKETCPICHQPIRQTSETTKIKAVTTQVYAELKYVLGENFD